ncbi:DNA helicase [Pseudomonas phage vB_PpuM-Amme-1]
MSTTERVWSKQQNDIFNEILKKAKSMPKDLYTGKPQDAVGIDAGAGSGKTTLIIETIRRIRKECPKLTMRAIVFNTDNAKVFDQRIKDRAVSSSTMHSYGLELFKTLTGSKAVPIMFDKWFQVVDALFPQDGPRKNKDIRWHGERIRELGIPYSDAKQIRELITGKYRFLIPHEKVVPLLPEICEALEASDETTSSVDFNDMSRMVLANSFIRTQYAKLAKILPDVLFVDEFQDFNLVQHDTLRLFRRLKPGMLFVFVGDPWQAIYAFRGGLSAGMADMFKEFNAKRLPSTTTYRSKSKIVEFVKGRFPNVPLEAFAEGGQVKMLTAHTKKDPYRIKSMIKFDVQRVVSARNKHLIRIALEYMDRGLEVTFKKAKVLEQVIGVAMRCGRKSTLDFVKALDDLRKEAKEPLIKDAADAALYIVTNWDLGSAAEVKTFITKIIANDHGKGVELNTSWGAKGMESERVAVIDDWFDCEDGQLPHVQYVSYTRASDLLLHITPHECVTTTLLKNLSPQNTRFRVAPTEAQLKARKEWNK